MTTNRLICTDPGCSAPGMRRVNDEWWCLFHPDTRRPDIDAYTGKVRETLQQAKAREREEQRVARELTKTEKPVRKVIRPPAARKVAKPRPSKAVPLDHDEIVSRYERGQSIHQIAKALHTSQHRISPILHDRDLITSPAKRREQTVDVESVLARYLAGERAHQIATDLGVRQTFITELLRARDVQILYGNTTHNIDEQALVDRYQNGEGLFNLAQEMRIGARRARQILDAHGVKRRARGQVIGRRGPAPKTVDEAALVADYLAGENTRTLTGKYRISSRRAAGILRAHGVLRPPAHKARSAA